MEERIRKENEIIKGNQMILYRNLKYQKLFDDVCTLLASEKGDNSPDAYACANSLIELAVTYGFKGNLWHCFLAFCMANHENAYSTSCEIKGPVGGTLNVLAAHDFRLMRKLFSSDIAVLDEESGGIWELMKNYESTSEESRVFNRRIRNRIVELAAALKNVIALSCGVCDGLGYQDNTKALLMTRAMAEITRLGEKLGGSRQTFGGLAGMGDLIVTCASVHSRNRKAGYLMGKGYTMQQAMDEVKMVVEGVYSAKAAKSLAEKYDVDMPIIMEVNKVLFEDKPAADAVRDLMIRDKKVETPMLPW